jgi:hypothetical protein
MKLVGRTCIPHADPPPRISLVPARTGHYAPDMDPLSNHYTEAMTSWLLQQRCFGRAIYWLGCDYPASLVVPGERGVIVGGLGFDEHMGS